MIGKKELLDAIEQCENGPCTYQNCEKLANLYTVYDHLFTEAQPRVEMVAETDIESEGDSEFFRAINGRKASNIWTIMDELMETLRTINPRLYDGVMRKISE